MITAELYCEFLNWVGKNRGLKGRDARETGTIGTEQFSNESTGHVSSLFGTHFQSYLTLELAQLVPRWSALLVALELDIAALPTFPIRIGNVQGLFQWPALFLS